MNLIQFLALKLHQGPMFFDGIVINGGRSSLQDEFRAGRPKSVVVPETIDAVRQLTLQDCQVTYREIEATLGISETSIQYTKTFVRVRSLTICHSLKKNACVD